MLVCPSFPWSDVRCHWRVLVEEQLILAYVFNSYLCFCIENGWNEGKDGSRETSQGVTAVIQERDDSGLTMVVAVEVGGSFQVLYIF